MPKEETIELRHIRGVIGEKEDLPSYNPRTSIITKLKAILLKIVGIPDLIHKFGVSNTNKTLTLEAGENNTGTLYTDGKKLYLGTQTIPAKIIKIDIDNFIRESVITLDNTGCPNCRQNVKSSTSDGSNLYIAYDDFRVGVVSTSVYKININSFTLTSELSFPANQDNPTDMLNDGSFIYVLSSKGASILKQISIDTFTISNSLALGNADYRMCLNGRYIYTVSKVGIVNKIDIDSYSVVSTLTYAGEDFRAVYSDGNYLYVGNSTVGVGNTILYRIDIDTFTKKDYLVLTDADYPASISNDGTYLYVTASSGVTVIVDILNFTVLKRISSGNGLSVTDGLYLYIGTTASPATIIRKYLIPTIGLVNKQINNINRLSGTETVSSYNLPNDLVENIAIEITITTRQRLDSIWLDFINLTQNVTIKVYHKIDATTYRQYDTYYWTTGDEDGILITDVTINNDWKLTITSDVVQGGIKAIPYNIIKTVME